MKDIELFYDFTVYPARQRVEVFTDTTKKVHVLTSDTLTDEESSLLQKILGAAKLSASDYSVTYVSPNSYFQPDYTYASKYICFGLPPESLALRIEKLPYYIFSIRGSSFIFCHKLSVLADHVKAKKALWDSLQALFELR